MPSLEFRAAKADDFEFAWTVYAKRVGPLIKGWANESEKARFILKWGAGDNYIVQLDGENIGWFSCVSTSASLTVDNLHLSPGYRGVPSIVLNILVLDGRDQKQKVMLHALENDPTIDFFKDEGFPIVEGPANEVTIDVSFALDHWHRIWGKKTELPWHQKVRQSHAPVPA
jgi:hypothetical protein